MTKRYGNDETNQITMGNPRNRKMLFGIFLLFVLTFFVCVGAGAVYLSPARIVKALLGKGEPLCYNILMYVRIPRVAACALAGAGLSCAGVLIQSVLQNPLAGPNIIGVNAGAGLAVVLCAALFPVSYRVVPVAAFVGAITAMLFIYFLAQKTGASRITLVLAGVCVNSFFNAMADVVHTLQEDVLTGTYGFRLGGFGSVITEILIPAGILIGAALLISCLLHNELEILSLGEELARSLGLKIHFYRFLFLALAAILAGASVSIAGLLGFVGLIVPHMGRRIVGAECRYLLPFTAMFGALFVMLCDLAARMLFRPYELPTGILLSVIGAPFFLYLLFTDKRRRSHD